MKEILVLRSKKCGRISILVWVSSEMVCKVALKPETAH